jgi:MOSC domain-containing protein YiiM
VHWDIVELIGGPGITPMHIVSVNVGRPREVTRNGQTVLTSIWKDPVEGSVRVRTHNLDGDAQSDLRVHGGTEKAVYAYPSEHYDYWRRELEIDSLPWGAFGENLTTAGIIESGIGIGDHIRIGSAELMVTQPRLPCFKLGIRFDRDDMIKRFMRSGRSGFYLAVVLEGELAAGDRLEIVSRDPNGVTVADVAAAENDSPDRRLLKRVIAVPALPESWKRHLRSRLK